MPFFGRAISINFQGFTTPKPVLKCPIHKWISHRLLCYNRLVRSKIMPSSSVAQILLRIFALNWFLTGLIQIASMAFTFQQQNLGIFNFAPSVVYFVAGILAWVIAPKLSRFLAHRNDGEFNLKGVTEQQLYAAVFLGLGLYFTLTSFAGAFSWTHFFAVNKLPDYGFHQESQPSYYDLSETVMTLGAGIVLIFTCNTWAGKLARKQQSEQGGGRQAATRPEST